MKSEPIHLSYPRGGLVCGARTGSATTDVERTTCDACCDLHEEIMQEQEDARNRGLGMMPRADTTIRPKADLPLIRERLRAAWNARADALAGEETVAALAADLNVHLARLYPPSDMAVLAKYGLASPCDVVTVNVQQEQAPGDGFRYSVAVGARVEPSVLVPDGEHTLWCGVRYSRLPSRGLTERARTEMEEKGELAAFCADQEAREARFVPEAWEAYFREVAAIVTASKRDQKRLEPWFAAFREEHGRLPRWSDLREAFPVLAELSPEEPAA